MNTAKIYYDSDDNECTIHQMVRREPEWAASRIQAGEAAIERLKELESSRSPGCSIADRENTRDLILRDVCEAEPADPDHEQTICISYDYLRLLVDRNLGLTSD